MREDREANFPIDDDDDRAWRDDILAVEPDLEVVEELVAKHQPGKHNQLEHGRKKQAGPSSTEPEPAEPVVKESNVLAGVHHIKRNTLSVREEEVTLKNGKKKTRKVFEFEYIDSVTGKKITNEAQLTRFRKLAPPDVTDVYINADPEGETQVTWLNKKGKRNGKYSKAHDRAAAAEKFDRLRQFTKALPKLRRRIHADLDSEDAKDREAANVMYLIDITGFRVGSMRETKADVQAYGASTLLRKHVHVNGNKCTFDFIGKKGVKIHKSLSDARLARIIEEHKVGKGPNEPLFDTNDGKLRNYLKKIDGDFIVKDFRTYNGTAVALQRIKLRKGPAPNEATFKKWQNEVGDVVSKHLGNGRTMAINAYIDPHVWDPWRQPEWGTFTPKALQEKSVADA